MQNTSKEYDALGNNGRLAWFTGTGAGYEEDIGEIFEIFKQQQERLYN